MARWRGWPVGLHAAALLLLVGVVAWRFWPQLTDPLPRIDESFYLGAIDRVAEGRSPFGQEGYFYPSAMAYAGAGVAAVAQSLGLPGEGTVSALLRLANLLGSATILWFSVAWAPGSWGRRLLLAAALACLLPGVRLAMLTGNLSLAVVPAILVGLWIWRRHPVTAGILLGASAAVKPLAPAAVLALGVHRPTTPGVGWRHRLAAAVAIALAATAILGFPHLGELLHLAQDQVLNTRTFSVHRVLLALGLAVPKLAVQLAVALGVVVIARRRPMGPTRFLIFGVVAVTLAAPMLWNHTLLVTLPIQVMAVRLAWRRWGRHAYGLFGEGRMRLYSLVLVTLAVAAIQFCDGVDGVTTQGRWLQILGFGVPTFAPAALGLFVVSYTDDI